MGEIKSAAEIAREKIEKLGEVTEEERLKWKCVPEGEKLATRYLKEGSNLAAGLNKYEGKAMKYVMDSAADILMRTINLPKTDAFRRTNKKAMDGLKILKNDKVAVENVLSQIRRVLDYYQNQGKQQEKQVYESLRAEFTARVQEAIKKQTGTEARMNIDVERQPQFQEEWRRLQVQLDMQYAQHLDEYKRELSLIA